MDTERGMENIVCAEQAEGYTGQPQEHMKEFQEGINMEGLVVVSSVLSDSL